MTQEELAGELNVTRQALSNWERDVNEPDLNTLKKICFLFGVHMDDFAKEVITNIKSVTTLHIATALQNTKRKCKLWKIKSSKIYKKLFFILPTIKI